MIIAEILMGMPYYRLKHHIKNTEFNSREQHINDQKNSLARILEYAVNEIPYYNDRFAHLSADISPENAFEILLQFPLISKPDIREHIESLYKKHWLRALKMVTAGTTGSPMPFYMDRLITRQREKAFIYHLWAVVDYKPGDCVVSFTARVPKNNARYSFNRLFNQYNISSFDLIPEKIENIIDTINQINPKFLHGYPSTISALCKLIQKKNIGLTFTPRAVFCGSEKILPHQRKLIKNVFNTTVYTWYGHSEYCVLGGECEFSQAYHLYPQYGYVEFLPIDAFHGSGKKLYEIIATGFNNSIMPLIRYRTGDYAVLSDTMCKCGRQYPLVEEVVGRTQEFFVDREENLVSVTVLTALFEKLPFIDEVSVFQDTPGKFILYILPFQVPTRKTIDELQEKIKNITQGKIEPQIELVRKLPKAPSGKHLILDQHIDMKPYLDEQLLSELDHNSFHKI